VISSVMTMRPEGRRDSYVYEPPDHELQRTVEALEPSAPRGSD